MFGVRGGSWIALGEPVGPAEERLEILWQFRELCDRHGAWPAFYHITPDSLPQFVELGLTFQKLGEERWCPSKGSRSRSSRTATSATRPAAARRLPVRDRAHRGCAGHPGYARRDLGGMAGFKEREKGFSLGRFDRDYMRNFPIAVVRVGERIVAFANVWADGGRRELSIDLMRHVGNAPNSIMEYLFLELMLWGKEQQYERFTLGMVPLFGLERRRLAPLWSQAGALLFRYGEHFYNFQGLLRFKAKFEPVWEPRYLAAPGGFALPRVLRDVTLLISGGVSGLVAK